MQISKRTQDHGILIHQNTFSGNSAIYGASTIMIEVLTDIDYDSDTQIGDTMICAGVQISDNLFEKNVGCYQSIGLINAMCGTAKELQDNKYASNSFEEPSRMSKDDSNVMILEEVMNFTFVKNHTMNSNTVTIDLNKFMLMNNTYENNYITKSNGLINFYKIMRLHFQDETFASNTAMFKEALNYYGSISSSVEDSTSSSGALFFKTYFDNVGEIASTSPDKSFIEYPNSVVKIQGSIVIDVDGATFDSNYILPPKSLIDSNLAFSETFSFFFCKGLLTINRMNAINMNGIDLEHIETIIGEDEFSNIVEARPKDRFTSSGLPREPVNEPRYYVNFGAFHPIIKFYDRGLSDGSIQQNSFHSIEINNLYLSNITFYSPTSYHGFFTSFTGAFNTVRMINFTFENID